MNPFELAEIDHTWEIIEDFEIRGDEVFFLTSEEAEHRLSQYVVEHRTRAIPMLYLQEHEPELFESMENTDEEYGPDVRILSPFDLRNFDLAVKDYVLEDALDRMPTDEYVINTNGEQEIMQTKPFPDVDVPNVYDRELEAISLYSRNNDNSWKEEEFMCFQMTLTEDSIPALIQHMYAFHTRMISLYDLRLIAPDVCESLYNIEEEWSIDNYSEKEQKNLYVGLRGDIVERVFDLIYDSEFFTI